MPISFALLIFWWTKEPGLDDTHRITDEVYVCSEKEEEVGVHCKWAETAAMRAKMGGLFHGCMRGRTLYVVPAEPLPSKRG